MLNKLSILSCCPTVVQVLLAYATSRCIRLHLPVQAFGSVLTDELVSNLTGSNCVVLRCQTDATHQRFLQAPFVTAMKQLLHLDSPDCQLLCFGCKADKILNLVEATKIKRRLPKRTQGKCSSHNINLKQYTTNWEHF